MSKCRLCPPDDLTEDQHTQRYHTFAGLYPPVERDAKLLQFTLLALAVQGNQGVAFCAALRPLPTDPAVQHERTHERRLSHVQLNMAAELQRLVQELWPT